MCLGVPMMLTAVSDARRGSAELGGVQYEIDLSLIDDPQPGQYVIVHAGFAIERLKEADAQERLALFAQLAKTRDA